MTYILRSLKLLLVLAFITTGCKQKIKQQDDKVYSRHLQRYVDLTILSTPLPDDKSQMNLLLLNDGQDIEQLRLKDILDSLQKKKAIQPLLVIAIKPADRNKEYGVAGATDFKGNGAAAEKYSNFVNNELYDFIKKKTGVRKFNSIAIAGASLGGVSAFDIAWDHADRIDKVGVLSGSFWLRDKDITDSTYSDDKDRLIINKIRSSRKRPKLQYWFYAGNKEETSDRNKDGVIDVVDDTNDLVALLKQKNVSGDITVNIQPNGTHDYKSWSNVFPQFLVWAFGQ